jgi:hypothetical protein
VYEHQQLHASLDNLHASVCSLSTYLHRQREVEGREVKAVAEVVRVVWVGWVVGVVGMAS